jgi:hypothetical protein
MTVTRLSTEQRQALALLASSPDGINEELLLSVHRFSRAVLSSLVRRRLAATDRGVMKAGGKMIRVFRIKVTDAGRKAIEG